MKNFLIGLGLGLVGFIGVIFFGVIGALGQAVEEPTPAWLSAVFGISLFILLAGPLFFWLITPIRSRLRKTR